MDQIAEQYTLQSVEQLRAVADPLRIRIFEALVQRPMTAKQVGQELGIAASKAHYHVRELERLGLARLVETRERGGILEKYYRAVARTLSAPQQLLQSAAPGEVAATITEIFASLSGSFVKAMERYAAGEDVSAVHAPGIDGLTLWMTPQELRQAMRTVGELFSAYRTPRGVPGEREASLTMIAFDARLAEQTKSGEAPSKAAAAPIQSPITSPTEPSVPGPPRPRLRPVVIAGAVTYSRDELARVVAAGEQLDLGVVGDLSFGADVTAELVDQAIAHLHHRGALSAPSAVREVLKRKEA